MSKRAPLAPRTPRRPSRRRRRLELLATGGLGALVATFASTPPGWAQSFQATGSPAYDVISNQYTATVDAGTPGQTIIHVHQPKAVITWDTGSTGSGVYNFQPTGTTATFSGVNDVLTDFTVLNIINDGSSRAVQFNGTVNSVVYNDLSGQATGGNIWFFNPGGIILGPTASFNVGSLLLSTATPSDTSTSFADDYIQLGSQPGSQAAVQIMNGAQINASNYVAIVAPQVIQAGTITAGGSVAMVAAEGATMTIPIGGGLFAISVDSGTTATNAFSHTGSTGNSVSGDPTAPRRIEIVAVPRNVATTMLLSGSIGYDAATAATSDDGVVVLGGTGAGISDGAIVNPTASDATLTIGEGTNFLSGSTVIAGHVTASATTANTSFAGNALIDGMSDLTATVASGHSIASTGDLTLASYAFNSAGDQIGGNAIVTVGGSLTAAGTLSVSAAAIGHSGTGDPPGDGGNALGGTAVLTVNQGAGGDLGAQAAVIRVDASGTGGTGADAGGNGTGGSAALMLAGGKATASAGVVVTANGTGGDTQGSNTAGTGHGGVALISLWTNNSGVGSPTLSVPNGAVGVTANGIGGTADCVNCIDPSLGIVAGTGGAGGAGVGGTARLNIGVGTFTAATVGVSGGATGGDGALGAGFDINGTPLNGGPGDPRPAGLEHSTRRVGLSPSPPLPSTRAAPAGMAARAMSFPARLSAVQAARAASPMVAPPASMLIRAFSIRFLRAAR